MANIWLGHVTGLLFIFSGIVQGENVAKQNTNHLHDKLRPHFAHDGTKSSETWSDPMTAPQGLQRKKRMASEEEELADAAGSSAYLASDEEKRARSSFRGDLGKRMLSMSRGMSDEGHRQVMPHSWLQDKRMKVSSRFRGDLGKRARSSFRGDLGKRHDAHQNYNDFIEDGFPQFQVGDSVDSYKYGGGDQTEQLDGVPYNRRTKEREELGSRPFSQLRGN